MRLAAMILGLFLCGATAGAADPVLKLSNSSSVDIEFYYRPVGRSSFGPPVKLPTKAAAPAEVKLTGDDPYYVEVVLVGVGSVYPDRPLPLRKMAEKNEVYDLGAVFEKRTDKNGTLTTIGIAFLAPKTVDDSTKADRRVALNPAPAEVRALMTSKWDGVYTTPGGKTVAAAVTLNLTGGEFKTDTFTGALSDVRYSPDAEHFVIQGKWEAQKVKGAFVWKVSKTDRTKFTGEWREDGSKAWLPWNGTLKAAPAKKSK